MTMLERDWVLSRGPISTISVAAFRTVIMPSEGPKIYPSLPPRTKTGPPEDCISMTKEPWINSAPLIGAPEEPATIKEKVELLGGLNLMVGFPTKCRMAPCDK